MDLPQLGLLYSKMKKIKFVRIALSVLLLVMVTAVIVDVNGLLPDEMQIFERMQFMPALLSFGIGIDLFWLFSSFCFGRMFCSTVCPLGTVHDVFGRLGKMPSGGVRKHYRYALPKTRLRYACFAVFAIAVLTGFMIIPALVEPYSIYGRAVNALVNPSAFTSESYQSQHAIIFIAGFWGIAISGILALAIATVAFFKGRLFCNTICPVGTVLGLCSRNSLWHFEIDTDKCVDCRRCEHVCKSACINLSDHSVDMSRCVVCFNCINACDDGAIEYTPYRKRPATPLMQRIKEKAMPETAAPAMTMAADEKAKKVKTNDRL